MKQKRFIVSLFILVFTIMNSRAQQLITDESQLKDGQLVALIGTDSTGYYPFSTGVKDLNSTFYFNTNGTNLGLSSPYEDIKKTNPPFAKVESAIYYSHVFRVIKSNGKWLLFDANTQEYLCNDLDKATFIEKETFPSSYMGLKYTPYTDINGTTHLWKLGKRYISLEGKIYYMENEESLANLKNPPCAVNLYSVGEMVYAYNFNENRNIKSDVNISKNIFSIWRTFKNNELNTLALTIYVPNYKSVFGFNTQAYEPITKDDGIDFVKIGDNDTLKFEHPYIITGEFFAPPYIIPSTESKYSYYEGIFKEAINNVNFYNVYAEKDIAGEEDYYISDNKLYYSKNAQSVIIKPFRWYFDTNGSRFIKQICFDGEEIPTSIKNISADNDTKDHSVYNLQGMKIATSSSTLNEKGLFIYNGKIICR